ncbi:polyribonucleotide nucleotidyltransferase [Oceanospirillum linum]|uniref:Polyribonucleotide nucleotidyltransferase n=1 Tax=Oceanospirillum linum TaxID=966 RepID=A0A1T1H8N5_OCELI|nr:polyribonucleotide nucleotidyltransferase [Oceanospirillum linum]OOV86234.1 polyribonucleotide nucleotidyltransferase [Oceanospirillum linum]SEG37737.1 polyribonucleotide nucleotidyltransferase [Oleiphilus messinensis]SMP32246.1 polyribonucleotide nucleotidyltransferase [Oceanospirillum linum]
MNPVTKTFNYGDQVVTLETGRIARQATGSVMVTMGSTSVLCAVVAKKDAAPDAAFFPLSVHYQEKTYAVGKIPGGYFKREGRPTETETLTSRLIDRPIRPLFPNGFMNEVQVVCTVMSADKDNNPDIAALIGTSAALAVSGVPFSGPVGAARVGFTDEDGYILNPTNEKLEESLLDMVVAGTENAVLMVESEAEELTEDEMLGAVLFAHKEMQAVNTAIKAFAAEVGTPAWDWQPAAEDTETKQLVSLAYADKIKDAYKITVKQDRYAQLGELKSEAVEKLANDEGPTADAIKSAFASLEKQIVRQSVVNGEPRIDGREQDTVRDINVEVGMLQKTHGSALFTRGETQAIVTATLGTARDAQISESLAGEVRDPFMLHYNFPPYSVGEAGFMGGPKRREIGHGRLARRGVQAVLPTEEEFPYSIRVVSEITESNGSSSMASVCGASLALMDAGVPLKAPVAGIAMGLVKEGEGFAVLTDILGDEDHLGDMDFKVAGTSEGITALQMDIKIEGINEEIMEVALQRANKARLHILGEMNKVISEGREDLSENAPAMTTIKIDPEKIRDVIGKGGATIRSLCERTGASIDIDDNGLVKIYAENKAAAQMAINEVAGITAEAEIGTVYKGKVVRLADFGAFVNFLPGQDGLVHISQIAQERVNSVSDYLKEGDVIAVKVLDVDNRGRVKLSVKEVTEEEKAATLAEEAAE